MPVSEASLLSHPAPRWKLPGLCRVCQSWQSQAVCQDCLDRFAALRPRCLRCGLVLSPTGPACGACTTASPSPSAVVAAVDYGYPWDGLITSLKFHGDSGAAEPLAQLLERAVRVQRPRRPLALIPVPPDGARLRERGIDHTWEIARRVGHALRIPVLAEVVRRVKAVPAQVGLDRTRRLHNLDGAFSIDAASRSALRGRRVALVDDVMTTGATVHTLAQTLLEAGAAEVQAWVVARASA